ncbi:MAG: methylenetetrahydrofolate reductase C-terminal domain-containing protein [Desulfobacterales bacterium]
MIVAERKPIEEILPWLEGARSVLVLGCNECVTVCEAGGKKEAGMLAATLRLLFAKEGREVNVGERTLERQCDPEYLDELRDTIDGYDAVVSLACGVGVQFTAERYPSKPVYPGVNTCFMGAALERGVWAERCQGCGQCLLALTGAVCPVARCAKRLLNGPCGGSTAGKCEIGPDVDCAWQLIIDRLKALGRMADYERLIPVKDWSKDRAGGPRKVVREDVRP